MESKQISMVQECVDAYQVTERPDGGIEIAMRVPRRFKDLWLVRLSQLRTNEQEIRQYEDEDAG
ncbi:MAG: hypothetical protein ACYC0X_20640 [Pirellulaceae bacterium]